MSDATPVAADESNHGAANRYGEHRIDDLLLDRIDAFRVLACRHARGEGSDPRTDRRTRQTRAGHRQRAVQGLARCGARTDSRRPTGWRCVRSRYSTATVPAPPKMPRLGPLTPIAGYSSQLMTRWIVKGYQNSLVTRIRKLYERREANSGVGHRRTRHAAPGPDQRHAGRAGLQGQPTRPPDVPARWGDPLQRRVRAAERSSAGRSAAWSA